MTGGVVVLGVFNADTIYRVGRMPNAGETILGRSFALEAGGKGSNQAVASARAGAPTQIISRLGKDAFAELAWETWRRDDIVPLVATDTQMPTGAACIIVEEDTGQNRIIVAPGAASLMNASHTRQHADSISQASVLLTQLEQPLDAAVEALRIAKNAGVRTILNPAPALDLEDEVLALCDFLTPNETEAEILTGRRVTSVDEARLAAQDLVDRGAGAVLMTLGDQGAYLWDGTTGQHIEPLPAGQVVDTTGAGDALNGAFAAALSMGATALEAAEFGNAASGWAITRRGAAPAMATRAEIVATLTAGGQSLPGWMG